MNHRCSLGLIAVAILSVSLLTPSIVSANPGFGFEDQYTRVEVDFESNSTIPDPATLPVPEPPTDDIVDNPYGKSTLAVGIKYETRAEHDRFDEVEEATSYWEENAEQFVGYSIEYEVRSDIDNPDVSIVFRDTISSCGSDDGPRLIGCAPIIHEVAPDTVVVLIDVDLAYYDMVSTITHELGHTLGLDHQDEPRDIMRHEL